MEVWICLDILAGVASILNLTAVSITRFIYITKPYKYPEYITKTSVYTTIAAIWFLSTAMAILKGITANIWDRPVYELLVFFVGFVSRAQLHGGGYMAQPSWWRGFAAFGEKLHACEPRRALTCMTGVSLVRGWLPFRSSCPFVTQGFPCRM